MGCVSSKLLATTDLERGFLFKGKKKRSRDPPTHIVSLTSTTYGLLNLDPQTKQGEEEEEEEVVVVQVESSATVKECKVSPPPALLSIPQPKKGVSLSAKEQPEIINAWELMSDLYDSLPIWSPAKMPAKSHSPFHPSPESAVSSKKQQKKKFAANKENNSPQQRSTGRSASDSSRILRPFSSIENTTKNATPNDAKMIQRSGRDSRLSGSRRSSSPLFDPELVALFERELCEEGEQIKKMVDPLPRSRKALNSALLLQSFEEKCPPGGANAVVLYTTTLRGIRKTFEECNAVRSAMESHDVQIVERDTSMDSGFREELRELMGRKEVRIPVVFVKGRLIGGAEEVLKLEEDGKLGWLLEGLPRAVRWCEGCAGMRFVMCMECNGSCKVLDEEGNKMVKCEQCNENGLIHCPICCS